MRSTYPKLFYAATSHEYIVKQLSKKHFYYLSSQYQNGNRLHTFMASITLLFKIFGND